MSADGLRGRRFRDHRQVIKGIIFRQRTGCAWWDLPAKFGPWQTVWKRQARFSRDGTWDRILTAMLTNADAVGELDWTVSVDSTVTRAHQHATNLPREAPAALSCSPVIPERWYSGGTQHRQHPLTFSAG
ncbi:MAG TPA: transposase [Mycobacteriales bacterium]|jgi:transposase|nr:transposase [Mycobacteriales bacterium]